MLHKINRIAVITVLKYCKNIFFFVKINNGDWQWTLIIANSWWLSDISFSLYTRQQIH
jgi:hypothetical protein